MNGEGVASSLLFYILLCTNVYDLGRADRTLKINTYFLSDLSLYPVCIIFAGKLTR